MNELIEVKILGRNYKLSCRSEDLPQLQLSINHVQNTISYLKGLGKLKEPDKICVMAAIRIAGELINSRDKAGLFCGLTVDELASKINLMNSILDEALAPQEKLF